MYIDCNDKKQRRSVFEKLKETIGNALDCKSTHITLPICRFEQIEAVIERLEEIVEEQEERISIMEEGNNLGGALKFRDKLMYFAPRLSGKTAIDMQIMMERIKNGDPVVFVSKDKTTEFKPVHCCKDCNEPRMKIIRDAKTGERKEVLYCSWNGHPVTEDDYCSGFQPKDGDPNA